MDDVRVRTLLVDTLRSLELIASEASLPVTVESDDEVSKMSTSDIEFKIRHLYRLLRTPRG